MKTLVKTKYPFLRPGTKVLVHSFLESTGLNGEQATVVVHQGEGQNAVYQIEIDGRTYSNVPRMNLLAVADEDKTSSEIWVRDQLGVNAVHLYTTRDTKCLYITGFDLVSYLKRYDFDMTKHRTPVDGCDVYEFEYAQGKVQIHRVRDHNNLENKILIINRE